VNAEKVSPAKKTGWHRGWMHAALAILLGALLLLWPTLLNRSPFFLSDTTNYVRSADAAMFSGFGIRTDWTQRFVDRYQQPSAKAAADPQAENADHGRPVTIAG
jgi:hypothetical protein